MKMKIFVLICAFILIGSTCLISGKSEEEFQNISRSRKVHILPCADVVISINNPESYYYKEIPWSSPKDKWGLFRNIRVINGEASLIATCCPSINKCLFGYGYENNETVSLRIPLYYGMLDLIDELEQKIHLMGYAIFPILIVNN
jgi:hypothetical protein